MARIWKKKFWQQKSPKAQPSQALMPFENVGKYGLDKFDRDAELAKATGELERLFWSHTGRLVDKWPHYLPIHQRHLEPYKAGFPLGDGSRRPLRLLEIGVSHGGSLELWRKFLGPQATIFGLDVDPQCSALDRPDLPVRIGSQADPSFLAAVVKEMGGVDIVIDDGSHIGAHQKASMDVLLPLLAEGGLYIVEDTHTSYWPHWKGGYRDPAGFMELAKTLVDDMHGWYHADKIDRPIAKTDIAAVSFYDSIVVIEKRKRAAPTHVQLGTKSF